jgi:hypothetical protein
MVAILLDHFKPFAVLVGIRLKETFRCRIRVYCKSLGVKSTELWVSPFCGGKNASSPPEENFNGY